MSVEGRVREALRRELHASRPLVIDGDHDLDGCWALDRAFVGGDGRPDVPTAVQQVLDEVRLRPVQRATVAVAARMAEHLQRYRWPADLVVVPVPSSDPVIELLARAIAVHLEVPCRSLLRLRAGMGSASVERRITARARTVPAHVLLIDDRLRSGRTLRTCGWVLRDRGAQAVWAMVAAADVRTEPPDEDGLAGLADASRRTRMHERGELDDVWSELVGEELELPVFDPSPVAPVDTPVEVDLDADDLDADDLDLDADDLDADDLDARDLEVHDAEGDLAAGADADDPVVAAPEVADAVEGAARAHRRPPKRRNRRAHRR